jgi:hypothetical protein
VREKEIKIEIRRRANRRPGVQENTNISPALLSSCNPLTLK